MPRLLVILLLALCLGCEVRPLDPATGKAIIEEEQTAFDARTFVDANWEERILPTIKREALPLDSLLAALRTDEQTTYGSRDGEPLEHFIVRGAGHVLAVDEASRARLLLLDLSPYDGEADVSLQIGPVIRGTALRDALPFITFDQFVNQLEYANVSKALHQRLLQTQLDGLAPEALPGRDVRFYGVFRRGIGEIPLITPVEIQVEEGAS